MSEFNLDRESLQNYLRRRGLYDPVGISVNEIQIHLKADGYDVRDADLRFALNLAGFMFVATVKLGGVDFKIHARNVAGYDKEKAVGHALLRLQAPELLRYLGRLRRAEHRQYKKDK